ncbi:MAG: AMP-binding protein [Propionibacteriales bacterium]|nr:AMP-binding protein [Propionibacteriales bacterium]
MKDLAANAAGSTPAVDVSQPRWSSLNLAYLADRSGLDPDKTAIVHEGRARTYRELRQRHRRIANGLVELGVERFDRVGITTRNRMEYFETELGIAAAGGIMVSLSWRLSGPERVNLLRRAQVRVVFTEEPYVPQILEAQSAGDLPDLQVIVSFDQAHDGVRNYDEFCSSSSEADPAIGARLEDPHEIIYTSGTTGLPKGVVWTHGTVMWNAIEQVMDYALGSNDSTYVALDLNYIGGRHDFTWPMLYQGATVHLRRSGGFDAREAVEYVAENRITHVLWMPTMIYDILRVPDVTEYDTSSLKMIMSGGAPLSQEIIARAQKTFPGTDFVQVYGLTEGGGTVTFLPPTHAVSKIGSAGKASMHNDIRVVDSNGVTCAPNDAGEIIIKGPTVTPGYWDNPEATAESIRDGWLHTGDLGYMDEEGFLYVSGRKKDMIISGGMNIYPSEVEHVLREHEAVHDVAVIGVPDDKWGENVCAVIQPAPGATVDHDEILALCRERLAGFKKPTRIEFVDELPRTVSGKVQKYVLRERMTGRS